MTCIPISGEKKKNRKEEKGRVLIFQTSLTMALIPRWV